MNAKMTNYIKSYTLQSNKSLLSISLSSGVLYSPAVLPVDATLNRTVKELINVLKAG